MNWEIGLKAKGLDIEEPMKGFIILKCKKCSMAWIPNLRSGGRFRRGYWLCANNCNRETNQQAKSSKEK